MEDGFDMSKFLLTRKQSLIFLIICAIITAPFGLLTVMGQIENEAGLIMLFPMLAGLPWVLLYLLFDIPGFTSPGLSGTANILSVFGLMLFMVPVYINVYIVFLVVRLLRRVFCPRKMAE